ncbi:MAG: 2-amino-4-hydroxy-6-hydroxymethyldihydropteridine diphosphokinase [Methylotenera sp.]|nr:MAG: 2-amino-4-hydroxy-6-hydroxymethyldihydropteridine diphosphokinase [Methylotenera sp.]
MKHAYVALGSNLADPIAQVRTAIAALGTLPQTQVIKVSSLYRTAPIGYKEDEVAQVPDFINAVAELKTELSPVELLDALFVIENAAGRERPYRYAPRILDCDLLLYEDEVLNTDKLTLPHPRMHSRGFVLLPLFEIAPELSIPNHGKISALLKPHLNAGIQKLKPEDAK